MDNDQLRRIIEAALLTAGRSLDMAALEGLFSDVEKPGRDEIQAALQDLEADCRDRGYELKRTASGYRFQVRQELSSWMDRLWEEKPRKYSRAVLETLALIAYRQPVTRGDVEQVRGVAVSSEIIRTLQEREWVRTVGHRDVPGRPALYATTRKFLDDFNLASLGELPSLNEIRDLNDINGELGLNSPQDSGGDRVGAASDHSGYSPGNNLGSHPGNNNALPVATLDMEDHLAGGDPQSPESVDEQSALRELH